MTVLIIANGEVSEGDWLGRLATSPTIQQIIAADGGTRHLFAIGRPPDLLVGDGDSLTPELDKWLTTHNVPRVVYPADKDETDLELALLTTIEMIGDAQNTPIVVTGVRGGRIDQELANYLLLAHPQLIGYDITFVDDRQRVTLIFDHTTIHGTVGDTLSLIPIGGSAHVQHTAGLQWPLHDSTLIFGQARGVSNVLTADHATISVTTSHLLCIHIAQ